MSYSGLPVNLFSPFKKWMHIFKKLENACCASPSFAYFFSGQTSFFTTSKVKFLHHVGKKATQNSFSSKYLLEKKHALVLHILLISSLT